MNSPARCLLLLLALPLGSLINAGGTEPGALESGFRSPPDAHRPETWFHLIGGNVSRAGLTKDLEAVAGAGFQGIQLFHGGGRPWPGVMPQIQTLSPNWDGLIGHVADETRRLGLFFTMQNCPGWAMSGGPWITPDRAMRHLITSRHDVTGGTRVELTLAQPEPSAEPWRDYRDVAVLAFPTPEGDDGTWLQPVAFETNRPQLPWADLLAGKPELKLRLAPEGGPTWLELNFGREVTLRSIELPPIEVLTARRNFDPSARILVQVPATDGWRTVADHAVPRSSWQDRELPYPWVLAVSDLTSARYRVVFENSYAMDLGYLRFSPAARPQDWRGQAGYALRSLERVAPPVQASAAWVDGAAVVDLSDRLDANGRLAWDAPAGRWTIVRFGHVNTGVKNKPAPPEATGFECDKLSPLGAEQHFAGYIGRLSQPGGPADDGRLQGMLIDSWECFTQTWTPAMETEFAARRGYALRSWLPALAGWVVDNPRDTERFLRDWRATLSDMVVEHYFGRLAALGRERGLRLSFETAAGDVPTGDILEYYKHADVPMCEFWQPTDPRDGGFEAKPIHPTVSAARIYGKPRIAAEAFTNVPNSWSDHPFALKNFADRHFALGVTQLVFHTYTHNPLDQVPGTSFGNHIGSPFLRGQTWWRHMPGFTDYLTRCQFLLEQGRPVSDVLWYLGDDVDHKPRQDSPFPAGHRFDYLNADALLSRFAVQDGWLTVPEGNRWRVLWLAPDQCRRLTPATLAKIRDLLHDGATVIGAAPAVNPSLVGGAEADVAFARLVQDLWGDPSAESGDRRIGAGRLRWGGTLEGHLAALGIEPDVSGARSAVWIHREVGETQLYFVAADRIAPLDANLRFRAHGRPEFWDPLTGETRPVAVFHADATGTTIPLRLDAAGSVFVVFHPEPASTSAFARIALDGAAWADARDPDRVDRGEPFPHFGLSRQAETQPWVEPLPLAPELLADGSHLLAWSDGDYALTRASGETLALRVTGARELPLPVEWTLAFPAGWDAPENLPLSGPHPWSEQTLPGVRAFSGTATYHATLRLDPLAAGQRLLLDLGRVGDIAEVSLNGIPVATLWSAPFRVDLTAHVHPGENMLAVAVTNSWHNRLAYDAGQPEAARKTWTISPPPAGAPVRFAGLAGPVKLHLGRIVSIPAAGPPSRP